MTTRAVRLGRAKTNRGPVGTAALLWIRVNGRARSVRVVNTGVGESVEGVPAPEVVDGVEGAHCAEWCKEQVDKDGKLRCKTELVPE